MATIDQLRAEQQRIIQRIGAVNIELRRLLLQRSQGIDVQAQLDQTSEELRTLRLQLADVDAQIAALGQSSTSAAQEVQSQQPNGPTAPPQQTVTAAGVTQPRAVTKPSNAVETDTESAGNVDRGTDAPLRPLQQTQATDQYQSQTGTTADNNFVYDPVTGELLPSDSTTAAGLNTRLATQPGAGANDDAGRTPGIDQSAAETGRLNRQAAAAAPAAPATVITDSVITPQPNVLDRFSSYTYQASVYLLTPAQFDAFQIQQKKNVSGYNLLFQSGGAPNNEAGPQGSAAGLAGSGIVDGRNPFFPEDFYIDSITLENRLIGKSTSAAHSVAELKFTVIEPANISLIDCIYRAVQDMQPLGADGAVNYKAAVYLMVIRFYGYDQDGRIVEVGAADPATGLTDPRAVVEKFIPFHIRFINWSVTSKLVTYEFDCAPIGQMIANGTRRGTIPADVEISGSTVKSMLAGDIVYGAISSAPGTPGASTTPNPDQTDAETARLNRQAGNSAPVTPAAPSKASATPNTKRNIKQGLIAAMNEEQQRLVRDKIYEVADVYEIEFANGAEAIRDATVTKPGKKTNKAATPMASAPTQNPSQSSPDKNSMDVTARNFGVSAGMQLVQAIDLIIRNSNYITDQATVVINETTGQFEPNPKSNTKGLRWFNILMQVTQLEYDNKRNDFAYRVKFIIVPYTLVEFDSLFFPIAEFRGVHKRYPWWFTGVNSAVLDYQASFNALYNITVSGSSLDTSALALERQKFTNSMREIAFIQYQSRSTESSQGAATRANELAASAAEYLYNPSDNAQAKIRIIGDPAWIQQGSVTGGINAKNISYSPFEPDGTINFDTNDVMFEIVWQRPEDYDLNTGLADPYGRTQKTFGDREPIQSVVYRTRSVISEFAQGRFHQVLDGTLYKYPIPEGTNKATTAAYGGSTAAGGNTEDNQRAAEPGGAQQRSPGRASQPGTGRVSPQDLSQFNQAVSTNAAFNASAALAQQGTTGARSAPGLPRLDPGAASGEFVALVPTVADTAVPALPARPVTSNGETVGPTAADFAEAERIQRESGDPEAITAEQVAANRRLNNNLTGLLGFPRLPNQNTAQDSGTPVIARDT